LLKGDGKSEFEFSLKNNTKKDEEGLEFGATLMAGGYNVGGVFPYSVLDFTASRAKADGSTSWEMLWSENLKYDKFHVGFQNEIDDVKEASADRKYPYLKESNAMLGYESPIGLIWARVACF